MLFSIIIPTYNSKDSIRNCIDSILAQTFEDFEIVVIDDGSSDGTSAIIDDYAKINDKVKVYHFTNAGVSIARQRGVSLSNGEYLMFVDSDDTINVDLLEHIKETVVAHNHPDIVRYQSRLLNDNTYKDHQRYNFFDPEKNELTGMNALRAWSLPGKKYAVFWLFAFKKALFSGIFHFPNLRCHEDLALIPLLVAKSGKVVTTNYIGYNYTCNNSGSITNTRTKSAEASRARDFIDAYHYAIDNFQNIKNISALDLAFFVEDFNRRLKDKFDKLRPDLKDEFSDLFGI